MSHNQTVNVVEGQKPALPVASAHAGAASVSTTMSGGLLFVGLYSFRRTERRFADIV
jgi:hypothetical protein